MIYFFKGPVHVYTNQKKMKNIFPSFSPSIHYSDWFREEGYISQKLEKIKKNNLSNEISFINVGQISNYKNQLRAIKIVNLIKNNGYYPKLFLVGDGRLCNDSLDFIKKNNLNDNIFIKGSLPYLELVNIYKSVDFLIHTPKYEGYGKVIFESMVYGCIPIISDVGICKAIIQSSKSGLLLSDYDDKNARKIIDIFKSSLMRVAMIKNGRNYCKYLNIENWTKNLLKNVHNFYVKK